MSKHTSGPWKAFSVYADTEIRNEDGALVAVVTPVRCESAENARLIAAAPELLEELEDLVAMIDPDGPLASHVKSAKAAIAKATGENYAE